MNKPILALVNLPCPAKINWFLHVTGRREDGYHTLQTGFSCLDFGDTLSVEYREDNEIVLATPLAGVADADHLAVRAAKAMQAAFLARGWFTDFSGKNIKHQGVTLSLVKRIPQGAGLGGGSSNAASTMLALNALWGQKEGQKSEQYSDQSMSAAELAEIGLSLGADVPFFLDGRSSFAQGVGEVLSPVAWPCVPIVLAFPRVGVATPAVFKSPLLKRDTPVMSLQDLAPHLAWLNAQCNDLQPVAETIAPEIRSILDFMNAQSKKSDLVRMSGSGSSVFAAFDTTGTGLAAANELAQNLLNTLQYRSLSDTWLTRSLDSNPVHAAILRQI